MTIDFKGKQCPELDQAIVVAGHVCYERDNEQYCSDEVAVQAIIDAFERPMPDLKPTQFKSMIATLGLVPLIEAAFNTLAFIPGDGARETFRSAFSQYDAGTVYYWDRSLIEWRKLAPLFDLIYNDVYGDDAPPFDVDEDKLREAWIAASKIIY